MKKNYPFSGIVAALGFFVLIMDSEASLLGAREGIDLCIRTVIPALFPFFLLSQILISTWTGRQIPILRPLGKLLGIPEGSDSLLIPGFLGGYPVGAKSIHHAWETGCISEDDANRLLAFCSNAGPSFLFGMAAPLFARPGTGWILWGIQIISAILVGYFLRKEPGVSKPVSTGKNQTLSQSLQNAVSVTAQVSGWVICFRILTTFADRWFLWLVPEWIRVLFTGFLELSNGCLRLSVLDSEKIRFLLCSAMLSFGGICVVMQTASVTKGLKLQCYLYGRLLHTGFSLLLSSCIIGILPKVSLVLPFLLISGWKAVKRGSIPKAAGV